jgi:hypothetical protein
MGKIGMKNGSEDSSRDRWARFRFSVIGSLLAAPPRRGQLRSELKKLAQKIFRHPITGVPASFGLSTIERWYYAARDAIDPVAKIPETKVCAVKIEKIST